MSHYLNVNVEVKIKGKWKMLKFGKSDTWWCQGPLRDYISWEWEYDALPADLTPQLKKIYDSFDYKPNFYVRSYKELEAIAEKLREKWLSEYKDACNKNFFIEALNKAFDKNVDMGDDYPDIDYLESEAIYDWLMIDKFVYFIYHFVDMNVEFWKTEDVRLIFYID